MSAFQQLLKTALRYLESSNWADKYSSFLLFKRSCVRSQMRTRRVFDKPRKTWAVRLFNSCLLSLLAAVAVLAWSCSAQLSQLGRDSYRSRREKISHEKVQDQKKKTENSERQYPQKDERIASFVLDQTGLKLSSNISQLLSLFLSKATASRSVDATWAFVVVAR